MSDDPRPDEQAAPPPTPPRREGSIADVSASVADTFADAERADVEPPRRWTVGRIVGLVVVAAMIGFWVWAFSPLAPDDDPDKLDDVTYRDRVIPRCTAMANDIAVLPNAKESKTIAERLVVIDQGNAIVRAFVTDLRATVGGDEHDRRLLDLWVTDWEHYAGDREEYADRLRTDPKARFEVTARGGAQITTTIDSFASKNRLTDCRVPIDV